MNSPIVTTGLGELARSIQRIHDPHSLVIQSGAIVRALLGEDGIVRPGGGQALEQDPVRQPIAGVLQFLPPEGIRMPQLEEGFTGRPGQIRSQDVIVVEELGHRVSCTRESVAP